MFLVIAKGISKPEPAKPRGVLAVDVNEEAICYGNIKCLPRGFREKYSRGRCRAWLARKGVRRRIGKLHEKARNIVENWAKKAARQIVDSRG